MGLGLLKKLGVEKLGIVTHHSNLASKLIARAVLNVSQSGVAGQSISIVELSPIDEVEVLRISEAAIAGGTRIFFCKSVAEARLLGGRVFLVAIGLGQPLGLHEVLGLKERLYLLISDRAEAMRRLGLEIWRIASLQPGVYVAKKSGESAKLRIDNGELKEEELLSDISKAALDALIESMLEYGELTIKDAVNIISARFGLSRDKAREVLEELRSSRKVSWKRGKLELL